MLFVYFYIIIYDFASFSELFCEFVFYHPSFFGMPYSFCISSLMALS